MGAGTGGGARRGGVSARRGHLAEGVPAGPARSPALPGPLHGVPADAE